MTLHLLVDVSKKIKRFIDYKRAAVGHWWQEHHFKRLSLFVRQKRSVNVHKKRYEAALDKAWVMDITVEAVNKRPYYAELTIELAFANGNESCHPLPGKVSCSYR